MPKDAIRQLSTEVTENEEQAKGIFRLTLSSTNFPEVACPGQFVMLRTSDGMDPFLRRAFSIHDARKGMIQILYRVVGKGTAWLSKRTEGEGVDVIGPLGKGFEIPGGLKKAFLVAGGMGIAPFQFLISVLREKGVKATLFYGTKTEEEMVSLEDLKRSNLSLVEATEDGSRGEEGMIVDVFRKEIEKTNIDRSSRVYVCGPRPMLAAAARLCREIGAECEVSLESEMGCGLGTCMGCVTSTQNGYQRVCREGPVFSAGEVHWDER
jgi:dihydroorotate dehydrogenase electron transfer subunit